MTTTTANLGKQLTSKETARLLGVSEASVKRWADNGLLQMVKTAGGHRRFRPHDVAVFRRNSVHGAAPVEVAGTSVKRRRTLRSAAPKGRELVKSLYDTLINGRVAEVSAVLVRLHLDGTTVGTLADEALCPAMRAVGELWHQGELSVAEEHVATRTALEALQKLRASLNPVAHGMRAICCATEGDFHELPVQIGVLTLEAIGYEVINLGTSTPFYSLAESLARFSPTLVCVASTVFEGLDRATREFADLHKIATRKGISIVLGGAGFKDLTTRFPADLHAEDFRRLERFTASLVRKDGRSTNAIIRTRR